MNINLSSIFSARNVTLVVFILVVLVLGTVFDTRVGPEGMKDGSDGADVKKNPNKKQTGNTVTTSTTVTNNT